MAKDGTARGGARMNAGRKSKGLAEKIAAGNPGKRALKVMEATNTAESLPVNVELPEYMTEAQQGIEFELNAEARYREAVAWIHSRGCDGLVSEQLLRSYAMSVARWEQCERIISRRGMDGCHPTTGAPMASPYVGIAQGYLKQANNLWLMIFQIVKENSVTTYDPKKPPVEDSDPMERLLNKRNIG